MLKAYFILETSYVLNQPPFLAHCLELLLFVFNRFLFFFYRR